MNQITKKLFAATLLLSSFHALATSGQTYFLPRTQNGTAVDTLGWASEINKYDADAMYFCFKAQTEYRQSFNSNKLGQYLFFNGTNQMVFGGKNTTTAGASDVYGLNFLLSDAYRGTATVNPKVQSSITDFSLFVGFDNWVSGLWFSAHLPLVWTKWNTHLTCDTTTANGTGGFAIDKLFTAAVPSTATSPYADIVAAFKSGNNTSGVTGDVVTNWSYGKINGAQSKTRLGDVLLTLGYNLVLRENGYFGFGLRALLGAGGASKATYVFEPTVGYAGRQGIGGMIQGHYRLWERDEDHVLSMYAVASAEHLFANTQVRSFDLVDSMGGVGSRYDLVKKITVAAPTVVITPQVLENMINVGTLGAKIGINVVYDATLQFNYMCSNWSFELAYSAAGRGSESFKSWVDNIAANQYILYDSGIANVNALLFATAVTSENIDGTPGTATAAVSTTQQSGVIGNGSLNVNSALAPSVFSSCFFGGVNYTWRDNDWSPSVGFYADVEFTGGNKSLNTWGIGIQGNVSY